MDARILKVPNEAPYHFRDRIRDARFDEAQENLVLELCGRVDDLNNEVLTLKRQLEDAGAAPREPPGKKRKLDEATSRTQIKQDLPLASNLRTPRSRNCASLEVRDVSFVLPQRKKFNIVIWPEVNGRHGGIALEPHGVNIDKHLADDPSIEWQNIEQVICTPVPEKSSAAYNFSIIPSRASERRDGILLEPAMFTVPQAPAKDVLYHNGDTLRDGERWDQLFTRALDLHLKPFGKEVTVPNPKEFESALVQSHRKGEKQYHVRAHRGASEGFLFFLSTGILWGYRKPILFFPLHSISSVSYSSVLARTFNLNISVQLSGDDSTFYFKGAPLPGEPPKETNFEFSMVDQADHGNIDRYVKGHGLHDASLAEGRRAKRYNVNKTNGASGEPRPNGTSSEPEEEGELAKAERALQDAEDEEEEDYDPSGGESEGSGSDSDEEEDGPGDVVEGEDVTDED